MTVDDTTMLRQALRDKYEKSHAVIEEVPDITGIENGRADALGVSLYQSKEFELVGFELKVTRADWLRELKRPEKSERFRRYCKQWYLVTLPGCAVAKELPPDWGLLVLNTSTWINPDGEEELRGELKCVRGAKRNWRTEHVPTALWASLLRCALRASPLGSEFARGVKEGQRRERNAQAEREAQEQRSLREMHLQRLVEGTQRT